MPDPLEVSDHALVGIILLNGCVVSDHKGGNQSRNRRKAHQAISQLVALDKQSALVVLTDARDQFWPHFHPKIQSALDRAIETLAGKYPIDSFQVGEHYATIVHCGSPHNGEKTPIRKHAYAAIVSLEKMQTRDAYECLHDVHENYSKKLHPRVRRFLERVLVRYTVDLPKMISLSFDAEPESGESLYDNALKSLARP